MDGSRGPEPIRVALVGRRLPDNENLTFPCLAGQRVCPEFVIIE